MLDSWFNILSGNYAKILMLHRIASKNKDALPANQNMSVSPDELNLFIDYAKKKGWTFLSIDEVHEQLVLNKKIKKTLVLTADDGYRDNLTEGLKVMSENRVPLCIYITTSFPDKTAKLWWYALEDAVFYQAKENGESCDIQSLNKLFLEMRSIYLKKYSNPEIFFEDYFPGFSPDWIYYCNKYCLNWSEISMLSNDPFITIGAHTVNHLSLKNLEYDEVWKEIEDSKEIIKRKTKSKIDHFCYPFGGSEEASEREYKIVEKIGFKTATTTIGGNIYPDHKNRLTSLPRYIYSNHKIINRCVSVKDDIKYLIKKV